MNQPILRRITTYTIWWVKKLTSRKSTCKLRKLLHQFDNTSTVNTPNTTKQRNILYLLVLWAFATPCCQIDEDVFLICWCFFSLHVFSEVAARWALSATVQIRQGMKYPSNEAQQVGAVGGSVSCSRAPQSGYWRWRERYTFTPPTNNSCRTEIRTRNLSITSPTL